MINNRSWYARGSGCLADRDLKRYRGREGLGVRYGLPHVVAVYVPEAAGVHETDGLNDWPSATLPDIHARWTVTLSSSWIWTR
ncbi:hypothetical protein IBTHAUMO2_1050024 [Nitrosopumilaceae archaeon]|nr:hypothetical protein IBTHAUMO2_1050024 [Nitrosopumilaceae archaeon]